MTGPFDPDAPAARDSGIFGLTVPAQEARVHVLPVPFDATSSYRKGAAHAPAAVLAASHQVELTDPEGRRPYAAGIALLPLDPRIEAWNREASECAVSADTESGARVNALGGELNALVADRAAASLDAGHVFGVLGGDHSAPLGALEACAARHPGMGVLHFDAHADLRRAYGGFTWSHASIMDNVLERAPGIEHIVQVGVRDLGAAELARIHASEGRVRTLFDHQWARAKLAGADLVALVREWIERLPQEVWISFDVDGLDPSLCPNTGTPVPGGLAWHEACLWLDELAASKRRVLGFDLCEVSPGPAGDPRGEGLDAIVGARLLYRMIGTT